MAQAATSAVSLPDPSRRSLPGPSRLSRPGTSRDPPPGPRNQSSTVFSGEQMVARFEGNDEGDDAGDDEGDDEGDEVVAPLSPNSVKKGSNHYQTEMFFHERRAFLRR